MISTWTRRDTEARTAPKANFQLANAVSEVHPDVRSRAADPTTALDAGAPSCPLSVAKLPRYFARGRMELLRQSHFVASCLPRTINPHRNNLGAINARIWYYIGIGS